jgi:hypothetical protein
MEEIIQISINLDMGTSRPIQYSLASESHEPLPEMHRTPQHAWGVNYELVKS